MLIYWCNGKEMVRIHQSGVQFSAVHDSNVAHSMEVPDGAMIDTIRAENVMFIELTGNVTLIKIDKYPRGG